MACCDCVSELCQNILRAALLRTYWNFIVLGAKVFCVVIQQNVAAFDNFDTFAQVITIGYLDYHSDPLFHKVLPDFPLWRCYSKRSLILT